MGEGERESARAWEAKMEGGRKLDKGMRVKDGRMQTKADPFLPVSKKNVMGIDFRVRRAVLTAKKGKPRQSLTRKQAT